MAYETITIAREGAVAVLTLNRPDKLNALNAQLLGELGEALAELDRDVDVRAGILTGAGDKAFAAGADIAAMAQLAPADALRFSQLGHAVAQRIEQAHFPILGAVNGFALGGGC